MDLYFCDSMHKKLFEDITRTLEINAENIGFFAAAYLVCSSKEFDVIGRYIDVANQKIYFETLIESFDLSESDRQDQEILNLAAALYNGYKCDVSLCFEAIKGDNLKVALDALMFRYGSQG